MDYKAECFDVEADSVTRSTKGVNFLTEDELFGQVIAKPIAKIPDGEIKEKHKTEIQQYSLNAKRCVPIS